MHMINLLKITYLVVNLLLLRGDWSVSNVALSFVFCDGFAGSCLCTFVFVAPRVLVDGCFGFLALRTASFFAPRVLVDGCFGFSAL